MAFLMIRGYIIISFILIIQLLGINCDDTFATKNNEFALNFYEQIIKLPENAGKSFVYSPFSIQTAGALLYGASSGKTADEIHDGFNLISKDTDVVGKTYQKTLALRENDPSMKSLNKIYIRKGEVIASNYKDIAKSLFYSELENIAFSDNVESSKTISKFVEDNTNGKIKDFVTADKIDSDTIMFLLNVINFKGEWEIKFDKSRTASQKFYLADGTTKDIDMMNARADYMLNFIDELNAVAVDIPFKGSDLSMYIIKPISQGGKLEDVESNLIKSKVNLNNLLKTGFEQSAHLIIPKFKCEFSIDDMQSILEKLNVRSMFNHEADFSKLLENNVSGLYVSSSIHKALFEIDEQGASAAAATGLGVSTRTGPYVFNANVPFIYLIKGKNGEIYFMGRFTGKD